LLAKPIRMSKTSALAATRPNTEALVIDLSALEISPIAVMCSPVPKLPNYSAANPESTD